jgi:ABC-type amino acid transport substrate-binding protein
MSPTLVAQEVTEIPRQLIVATREVPPFAMKTEEGDWDGISIELLREVKAELQSQAEHEIKLQFRDLQLDEMLNAVADGEVDIAAAAITVNYEREKLMNFTHPFHSSGLGIAVASRQRSPNWRGVMAAVFSKTFFKIVGGMFVALLLSGVAVYFFERRNNREQFGGGAIRGIAAGLWWAAVTLTTVGYGDKVPKTVAGRMIGLVWMFAGLFIVATFTASVTSALTVRQLKSRIAGPRDLPGKVVATVKDSTAAKYLRTRHINYQTPYEDVRQALETFRDGKLDAVVYDEPILRHEVLRGYSDVAFVLPMTFERQDYAFAMPTDSQLREQINLIILRTISSPEWEDVLRKYLGTDFE